MTCGPRVGGGGVRWASSTSGGRRRIFSVLWDRVGLMVLGSQLACSNGLPHKSFTFRSMVFSQQWKMIFTCCATLHLGHRLKLLQILLKLEFIREQHPVLTCASQIPAIHGSVYSSSTFFSGGMPSCLFSLFSWVWTVWRWVLLSTFLYSEFISSLLLVVLSRSPYKSQFLTSFQCVVFLNN